MELNNLIFPVPKASYQEKDFIGLDRIFHVPSYKYSNRKKIVKVPCIFMPYLDENDNASKFFLIYFHGNAEDLGFSYDFLFDLRQDLKVNIIVMEYAGYGIYEDDNGPCHKQIEIDCDNTYNYVINIIGAEEKNIILFGRSMGSGPASYLAGKKDPRTVILMSPYTSIKGVAKNLVGILAFLVQERFKNIDEMEKIKCPVLFIHGKQDTLIPYTHSVELIRKCKNVVVHFGDKMTHNHFSLMNDIIEPISNFFNKINVIPNKENMQPFANFNIVPIYPDLHIRVSDEINKEKNGKQELPLYFP